MTFQVEEGGFSVIIAACPTLRNSPLFHFTAHAAANCQLPHISRDLRRGRDPDGV